MDPLISKPQRSPEELRMALENVTRQMIEVENDKKETAKRFNERLKDTGIGAGQQYFLDRIARCPGIAVTKLAQTAVFDNGTSARAVKKLADEGYVTIVPDECDGRVKRLYATEKAEPVVALIREMKREWRVRITEGFSEADKEAASALLKRLCDNAMEAMNHEPGGINE